MSVPVSQYEALRAEMIDLRHKTQQVQQLATQAIKNTTLPNLKISNDDTLKFGPSHSGMASHSSQQLPQDHDGNGKATVNYSDSSDVESGGSGRIANTNMSVSSEPVTCAANDKMHVLYHGTWPDQRNMWHSDPCNIGLDGEGQSEQDHRSVMSFASSSGGAPLDRVLLLQHAQAGAGGASAAANVTSQQLEAKVDMVYSLLAMLGGQEHADMGDTLLALSSSPHSCQAMRQAGCIPLLVQLVISDRDAETRNKAAQALHNLVYAHSDDKTQKRERRVLKLLDSSRVYIETIKGGGSGVKSSFSDSGETASTPSSGIEDLYENQVQTVAHVMKLSFDEGHRRAISQLGGIHIIARLVETEHLINGNSTNESNITLLRYACMALTNLTFGESGNKTLLCSFREFMRALVIQLQNPNDELRQVTASVLRNLSWRPDATSKDILREVGTVTGLMKAAMKTNRENTLKSILSALWNLSGHCIENKSEICAVEGALGFLVDMLTYRETEAAGKSLAIVENSGGILRNISNQIAMREDYREVLREHNCLQILLDQLKSPSLTIVSNACGTLWNLSAKNPKDQETLWNIGAPAMLRSLNHSKHKTIATGSSAALKNLLSSRPNHKLVPHLDHTAKCMDLPVLPTLGARKQRALVEDIDHTLAETFENIERDSPIKSPNGGRKFRSFQHKKRTKVTPESGENLLCAEEFPEEFNPPRKVGEFSAALDDEFSDTRQKLTNLCSEFNELNLSSNFTKEAVLETVPASRDYNIGYLDVEAEKPINYSEQYHETPVEKAKEAKSIVVDSGENAASPSPVFGDYAETDLDQPTDYSLRYAEDDSDSETCSKLGKETAGFLHEDTLKTYCTEGTPYETPFNYSTATSMSDLRCEGGNKSREKVEVVKVEEDKAVVDHTIVDSSDRRTTIQDQPNNNEQAQQQPPTVKVKSEFSSGVISPEKPVNYCDEGTPGYFSRVSSFGSLNDAVVVVAVAPAVEATSSVAAQPPVVSTTTSPPKLPVLVTMAVAEVVVENDDCSQGVAVIGESSEEVVVVDGDGDKLVSDKEEGDKDKNLQSTEVKVVKFEQSVNYAEETPLMFSRSSSLASLDSIEQHSIHDDRSSIISDFSRLTSGVVSPSELPDSPTQTIPPTPRKPHHSSSSSTHHLLPGNSGTTPVTTVAPRGAATSSTSGSIAVTSGTRQVSRRGVAAVGGGGGLGGHNSVFEDNITKFVEESTPVQFSTATSLSSLAMDEIDESINGDIKNEVKLSSSSADESIEKVDTDREKCDTSSDLHDQQSDTDDDDNILADCINIGMQTNRHSSTDQIHVTKPPPLVTTNTSGVKYPRKLTPARVVTSASGGSSSGIPLPKSSGVAKALWHPTSTATTNSTEPTTPSDMMHTYFTEDTPALLSHAGSNSDLSAISINTADNGDKARGEHNRSLRHDYFSDDSSNLSGENDNILAECIKSGMPRSAGRPSLPGKPSTVVESSGRKRATVYSLRGRQQGTSSEDPAGGKTVTSTPIRPFSVRGSTRDDGVGGVAAASGGGGGDGLGLGYGLGVGVEGGQKGMDSEAFQRQESLSSLSVESFGSDDALLEQCISSGMPKTKEKPVGVATKYFNNPKPQSRISTYQSQPPQSSIQPRELASNSKNGSAAPAVHNKHHNHINNNNNSPLSTTTSQQQHALRATTITIMANHDAAAAGESSAVVNHHQHVNNTSKPAAIIDQSNYHNDTSTPLNCSPIDVTSSIKPSRNGCDSFTEDSTHSFNQYDGGCGQISLDSDRSKYNTSKFREINQFVGGLSPKNLNDCYDDDKLELETSFDRCGTYKVPTKNKSSSGESNMNSYPQKIVNTDEVDSPVKLPVDDRMLDPDAMIESLDRFTAELVSQSCHLHSKTDMYASTATVTKSSDTWHDDNSPNDLTFPTISGSAPNVITFDPSDPKEAIIMNEELEPKSGEFFSNNFPSNEFSTETLTESTLIQIEAAKLAQHFQGDMTHSLTSVASLELDKIQPPSQLNSMHELPKSPKLQRKKSLPNTIILRRALEKRSTSNNTHASSLESLLKTSSVELVPAPPTATVDLESSMVSVASISSEIADVRLDFQMNGDLTESANPIFNLKLPFLLTSSVNSVTDLDNINPPSYFNEVTDSLADAATEFEDCQTHVASTENDITTEFSDAHSITPISSDMSSEDSAGGAKRLKSLSKQLTPRQRRNLTKERYKTYTIAAEMIMNDQDSIEAASPPEVVSPKTKLTAKERRQIDPSRFQTQTLEQPVLEAILGRSSTEVALPPQQTTPKRRICVFNRKDGKPASLDLKEVANLPVVQNGTSVPTTSVNNTTEQELKYRTYSKSAGKLLLAAVDFSDDFDDVVTVAKPKITKPSEVPNDVVVESNEEPAAGKGIRGKRKPLYTKTKPTYGVKPPIKTIKTVSSNLVRNVTSTLKSTVQMPVSTTKNYISPRLKNKSLSPPTQMSSVVRSSRDKLPTSSNSNGLVEKSPKLGTDRSPRTNGIVSPRASSLTDRSSKVTNSPEKSSKSKPPPVLERQGTFTKPEVNKAPSGLPTPKSRIARAIMPAIPVPTTTIKSNVTTVRPKTTTAGAKSAQTSPRRCFDRSLSANGRTDKPSTTGNTSASIIKASNSVQSLRSATTSPSKKLAVESSSPASSSSSTKQITSRIASLWRRVEESKRQPSQFPVKNDKRIWLESAQAEVVDGSTSTTKVGLLRSRTFEDDKRGVNTRITQQRVVNNNDDPEKRISRLGSFVVVEDESTIGDVF